ncbi:MAG: adenylate/guanylate cyclase domain-containing protein [Armatimonadetes bacterium]|nr:adenylate/guanylate cyclase domain-containing protein [Armatimonadota bacterium]
MKKFLLLFGLSTFIAVSLFLLQGSILAPLERLFYDWRQQEQVSPGKDPSFKIAIIEIDQESKDKVLRHYKKSWPWPRRIHARLIDRLTKEGADVIAFDLLFVTPGQDPEDDRMLGEAVRRSKRVVADYYIDKGVLYPLIPELSACAGGLPNVNLDDDGKLRFFQPVFKAEGKTHYHFATRIWQKYLGLPEEKFEDKFGSVLKEPKLPVHFHQKPTLPYESHSYWRVLNGEGDFKGKVVLIGDTSMGGHDYFPTPLNRQMAGVQVMAYAFKTLKDMSYPRPVGSGTDAFLTFSLALLSILAASYLRVQWAGISAFLALTGSFWLASSHLFGKYHIWNNMAVPLTAMISSYVVGIAYRYLGEERERKRILSVFQRYISPDVVKILLSQHTGDLGRFVEGMEREVTVLFTDIRGFTGMSERLKPKELVARLNEEYFRTVGEIVWKHKGTIDKYIGDAVMAVFGSPLPDPDHAQEAVLAAIEIEEAFDAKGKAWEEARVEPFRVGIGVNSGVVIVGDVGFSVGTFGRKEFAHFGDAVNLASRLEGLNKQYGTKILISQKTYDLLGDFRKTLDIEELESTVARGKTEAVTVYAVRGRRT